MVRVKVIDYSERHVPREAFYMAYGHEVDLIHMPRRNFSVSQLMVEAEKLGAFGIVLDGWNVIHREEFN